MTKEPTADIAGTAGPPTQTAEAAYLAIGLMAIIVLGAVLLQIDGNRWAVLPTLFGAVLPTLFGAAGLGFRWRPAPVALLAAVAATQVLPYWMSGEAFITRRPRSVALELALCAAVLAYVIAQYRLFGLGATVFPPDPRRPLDRLPPRSARSAGLEVTAALVAVAAATVGALFLWRVVAEVAPPWGIQLLAWRLGSLAWLLGGGLLILTSVIGHLGWRRLSRDQAELYLRDVLWHETRSEQRRIQRWRAWGQMRESGKNASLMRR